MKILEHKNSCCGRGLVKGSQEAKDWAKKMDEARKKKMTAKKETEPKVKIEMMGEAELVLPEFFATERKGGKFKLVNPMTKERNLSKRSGELSIRIVRKPVANAVLLEGKTDLIPLSAFSKKDRDLITTHFDKIDQYKNVPIEDKPEIRMPPLKERGRPERLQKNIEINKERNAGKMKKGRPSKYTTQEDARKAKAKQDKERYEKKKQAKTATITGEGGGQSSQRPSAPTAKEAEEARRKAEEAKRKAEIEAKRQAKIEARRQLIARLKIARDKFIEEVTDENMKEYWKLRDKAGIKENDMEYPRRPDLIEDDEEDEEDEDEIDYYDVSTGTLGRGIMKEVKSIVKTATQKAKAVLFGSNDLPRSVKEILNKYGNEKIASMTLMRTPVPKLLTGALSLFSAGEFGKKMEENHFDTLFHLFLEIRLESGKRILLEKNERINMKLNPPSRPHTEKEPIFGVSSTSGLTLNPIMTNTEREMGREKFLGYSVNNNCQDFLVAVLKANNLGDGEDISFIKQDTKQLFEDLPYLRKLSNTLTTIGAKVDEVISGGGKKKISTNNIMEKCCPMCGSGFKKSMKTADAVGSGFKKSMKTAEGSTDAVSSIGGGVKKSSNWIDHIRKFAKDNDMTYSCALSDPRCSKEYREKKSKPTMTTKEKPTMTFKEINDNRKIADKQAKEGSSKQRKENKQLINSQTKPDKEESYSDVSSKLQQMLFQTKTEDLKKVLVSLKFRGKLPVYKELQVLTILHNFKTIPEMKELMAKIKEVVKEEPSTNAPYVIFNRNEEPSPYKKKSGVLL